MTMTTDSAVPTLKATDITKEFHGVQVLKKVSATVRRGEVKVIVGPSGSGKSTLLRCLALLEEPEGGEILLEGESIGGRRVGDQLAPCG